MSQLLVNEITPYTGLTVTINGVVISGGTISATTYNNLPLDNNITGGTYSNGVATFTNNSGGTFSVTGFYTGATDVFVTGGTYSDGVATFTNVTGGTFDVTGFATSFTGGTVDGQTIFNNGLSATTVSATTYFGDGSNLTGIENYTEITYSQLYDKYTGSTLTPGMFYLITDFQTCYDQPNFDYLSQPIITNNFKTGNTEPLLVLSTSVNTLSPRAYSIQYPNDLIKYDITFTQTEVTFTSAKGRITERIDEYNNRADYDFRAVQFVRYQAFFSENFYEGSLSIDGLGNVVGINTNFTTDFIVGDILGVSVTDSEAIGGFYYYEILTISDNTNMTVTGNTYWVASNRRYSKGFYGGIRSPFQCNVPSYTGYSEYYTFNNNDNVNTYLGDNKQYQTFILSNNVFLNGLYRNNIFEGNVVGNTFDDDMDSNNCGSDFQYNIITNDFDDNTIGSFFQRNFIDCDMQGNNIVGSFVGNMLGDNNGLDFDFNTVAWGFRYNFITFYDNNFENNIIGPFFIENLIHYSFANNIIASNFNNNILVGSFDNNQIDYNFNNNEIRSTFTNNKIGELFSSNIIYSYFRNNQFGSTTQINTFGDSTNIGGYTFATNTIGNNFEFNNFTGETLYNKFGAYCTNNNVGTSFSYNSIGDYFNNNTIGDGFGFGYSSSQGNVIGNYFNSNTIGEYFYNNTIADGFGYNQTYNYFQMNNVKVPALNGVDFTEYYGNISAFTYTAIGTTAADGVYTGLQGTASSDGVNASFDVEVSSGAVIGVSGNSQGKLYSLSEQITILGSQIGGTDVSDDVVITVTGVNPAPSVYEAYNCEIFKNSGNINRLSFYDSNDILNIKNINI